MTNSLSQDVDAIQRIAAIPSILEVVHRVTGMGFAAITRVTDERWIACAVRDEIALGIGPGDERPLSTTICDEMRGHRQAIVIENVADDPIYHDHPTPRLYGFQSYISVPIVRTNGDFFGTLFAIDPAPARLANGSAVTTFNLFAQLISLQLDADERGAAG
ncbi:MAG: GAF domain-containing protein [Rhizorhabdus sp.]